MMKRRSFLKVAGLATGAATLRFAIPAFVEPVAAARKITAPDGKMYRGDRYGHIFVSDDAGATWNLHTYLGPEYPITRMTIDPTGRVQTKVGYRGRSFRLWLAPDSTSWMTA
jgi:hypothetical protein